MYRLAVRESHNQGVVTRRDFCRVAGLSVGMVVLPRAFGGQVEQFPGEAAFYRIRDTALKEHWPREPIGELVGRFGMALIGTPYVGGTLETSDSVERCELNFKGLDCVTFYESALGLARLWRSGGNSVEVLRSQVQTVRYRAGRLDGYLSRLHYTADWFQDNASRNVVKALTQDMPGAVRMDKPLNFMSSHPELYRQLKASPGLVIDLKQLEDQLTKSRPWYVPKDRVLEAGMALRTGDIIGIVTSKEGLDCSHTGLIIRDDSGARLLHASLTAKEVVFGPLLSDYLKDSQSARGFMAVRPL